MYGGGLLTKAVKPMSSMCVCGVGKLLTNEAEIFFCVWGKWASAPLNAYIAIPPCESSLICLNNSIYVFSFCFANH